MNRRQLLTAAGTAFVLLVAGSKQLMAKGPAWSLLEKRMDAHFQSLNDWQANDLISRGQVVPLLQQLRDDGFVATDAKAIINDTLPEDDFLVQQLRTEEGRRFIRKVSSQKLIYDQLDRVAHESGGKALIRRLIRLPDGEQFVRAGRPKTTPGLIELLPKQGSGKTRRVRDFDQPTKKIYTAEQLKDRLKADHKKQSAKPQKGKKS